METLEQLKEDAEDALRVVESLKGREQLDAVSVYNAAKKKYEAACRKKRNTSVCRSHRLGGKR